MGHNATLPAASGLASFSQHA